MGLSDFQVFNEFTYTAATEVLRQQVDLFNEATNGAIVLRAANNTGDFTDSTFYALIADLIRKRNVYGSGAVAEKELEMLLATTVKVAGGTPPVRMDPAWFSWINRDQEEAGAVYGRQLAVAMMTDMLNTAIASVTAALSGVAAIQHDGSSGTADFDDFLTGASKFGDASSQISAWIVHSHVMFSVYGAALANTSGLFTFGNINVRQDGFGRVFVVTDSPSLVNATPNPDQYYTLGLVPGAAVVEQNDDFLQNIEWSNGFENIKRTIQSEWSYNLGVKGFAWDKTSGGHSPNDAALGSTANWDRITTSHKDLAGVLVITQ
jgi:hypothetical protein